MKENDETQAGHPSSVGILLMTVAFVFFSVMDATAKFLSATLPPAVIVSGRYVFGALVIALAGLVIWGKGFLRTANLKMQLVRGLFMVLATLFNFIAVKYLQLAQTSSLLFSTPLWVCLLSPLLLGEHVGWRRWLAVLAGFLGVLLVLRPGTDAFHPAMLLSLAAAFTLSLYQIFTRKVGAHDAAIASLFWGTAAGAVLSLPLPVVTGAFALPQGLEWAYLIGMASIGSMGHFLLVQAHRLADASLLAPFSYTQLFWMILIGWLWFGDVPDLLTVLGALMVAGAGLFVFHRERVMARRLAEKKAAAS